MGDEAADPMAGLTGMLSGLRISGSNVNLSLNVNITAGAAQDAPLQDEVAKEPDAEAQDKATQDPDAEAQDNEKHDPDVDEEPAVWKAAAPAALGVWEGGHPSTWKAIEDALGQPYIGSGATLRRAKSLAEAQAIYMEEAKKHRAPLPASYHRVP